MAQLLIPQNESVYRSNNFDAIRLAMAMLVVWSHSYALFYGSEDHEPVSIILGGVYNSGNLAVMTFFVISGFLITHSFTRSKSLQAFIERRLRRIYPGYIVATSLCAFVVIPFFSTIANLSPAEVSKTVAANLLLRNYFPPSNVFTHNVVPNAVNGSLWSIPFEFWCYIGVAVVGVAGILRKRSLIALALIAVLLGRVTLDLLGRKPGGGVIGLVIGWPYLWFVILPSFLLGVIAYGFQDVLPRNRALLIVLVLIALGSAHLSAHLAHIVIAPVLAYATFYVVFSNQLCLHSAGAWGDFSYGTYLYAFPIQQMIVSSYAGQISFFEFVVLSLVLSLFAGACSWHIVEKHFVRRKLQPPSTVPRRAVNA